MSPDGSVDTLEDDARVAKPVRKRSGGMGRFLLIMIGPIAIIGGAAYFYLTGGRYQTTDNAYIQVAKAPVSSSVGGRVTQIFVKENQRVDAGQPLFQLDAIDFEVEAEQARAQLAQAVLQVGTLRASWERAETGVSAARKNLAYARKEAARQQELVAAGVTSQQDLDSAVHALTMAQSTLATAEAESAAALANLDGDPDAPIESQPSVMAAQARLKRAEINQGYTQVLAPTAGVVTRVQQLQIGGYVNPAQTTFWLMTGEPWVEANFKEDQLAKMAIGQSVDIKVVAFPGEVLKGHISSFSPGTGATFSALPAQNATGNWVSVTQRLPVQITFDQPPPEMAGRAGLSAHVKVDLGIDK